jgi:hypothetical protein
VVFIVVKWWQSLVQNMHVKWSEWLERGEVLIAGLLLTVSTTHQIATRPRWFQLLASVLPVQLVVQYKEWPSGRIRQWPGPIVL